VTFHRNGSQYVDDISGMDTLTYGIFSLTLFKFVWVNILTCTHAHPSK